MKAYLNDPKVKSKLLAQLKAHRLADEIVKGQYWEGGKGCAVGCTIHGSNHASYEPLFGIPQELAKLEDRIFEGLPNDAAKKWPERFSQAIKVGADLSKVFTKFNIWLLEDKRFGTMRLCTPAGKLATQNVITALKKHNKGIRINNWANLRAAAYAAAADATADAAYATAAAAYATADAAYAAADAADATAATAYAAADAADATARQKHYVRMANKLIELLRGAK